MEINSVFIARHPSDMPPGHITTGTYLFNLARQMHLMTELMMNTAHQIQIFEQQSPDETAGKMRMKQIELYNQQMKCMYSHIQEFHKACHVMRQAHQKHNEDLAAEGLATVQKVLSNLNTEFK